MLHRRHNFRTASEAHPIASRNDQGTEVQDHRLNRWTQVLGEVLHRDVVAQHPLPQQVEQKNGILDEGHLPNSTTIIMQFRVLHQDLVKLESLAGRYSLRQRKIRYVSSLASNVVFYFKMERGNHSGYPGLEGG